MTREKVVLLDQSQIGAILDHGGFAALDAIVGRGDRFLFVAQAFSGDGDGQKIKLEERKTFENWLKNKRYAGKVLDVDPVKSPKEQKRYDPRGKAGTRRNNQELWDMGVRKFMLENRGTYDFEVISRDHDFLDNRVGRNHPLKRLPFDRVSLKSAMTWLLAHPDVDLPEQRFNKIKTTILGNGFGESHNLEKHTYKMPESYAHARALRTGRAYSKLFRRGAPVVVLGIAAVPVFGMVRARADARNIPFIQAAGELGLTVSEEQLKSLAVEAGVDLAISLTPAGWVKKAWDVLGNIDDIVAVTELYGTAYPGNAAIQELAAIARTVERSAAFQAYVNGRDALVGAVGGAIDRAFGGSADDAETARRLGSVRMAVEGSDDAVMHALGAGGAEDDLAGIFRSAIEEEGTGEAVPLSGWPVIEGADPILSPAFSPVGEHFVPNTVPVPEPGEDHASAGQNGQPFPEPAGGMAPAISPDVDFPAAAAGGPDRQSSYDTYQRLGATPEEEARAIEEYRELLKKSHVDMGGHAEAAEALAGWRFQWNWGLSAFGPEGTVVKHPVEKVYPDLDQDGHGYVRDGAEALLKARGVNAARWYLSANEKTGRDRRLGQMDNSGFGPRMTLSYDGADGGRHVVTETFQADVRGTRRRSGVTLT